MVQAGFDGAERDGGDGGDFFEGKIFEHVEQKRGALEGRELFDEGEKSFGFLATDELSARIGAVGVGPVGGGIVFGRGCEESVVAAGAAPMLHAFLVGDTEEPRGEFSVFAQARDVADGGGESFLDDIEGGGVVAEEFGDVGVER